MTVLLSISDLNKRFGGVHATRNVSLDVLEGEVHAIIGPNGAGKTTLVSQISGEQMPDSGSVLFSGEDITRLPSPTRCHKGLARSFQITSVFPDMTVLENVCLAAQAHDGHSFHFWRPAKNDVALLSPARAALETVELIDRADSKAREVSHGERRQLEIAMALAGKPHLLLLDEPMAGMGPEESQRMVDILNGLRTSHTMLLVEHDMDAVFALADRISVLVYGEIIATGAPDEIRGNEAVRKAYLGEEAA